MITRLAPAQLVGAMMGIWFLSTAFAQYIAGLIAKLTSAPETGIATRSLPPLETIGLYGDVFTNIAVVAAAVGCALLLISPWLHRLMRQKGDRR
jgi:proton-dependent oligopeptide transporter, POT family